MDATLLIDCLSRALMDAYDALPAQDQEGPLGDQISAVLHDAKLYVFAQDSEVQQATIQRMATLPS